MTETLTCAHDGHTFEREQTRGRKPRYCPEHRPVVETKAKVEHSPRRLSSDGALEVLCADNVDPHLRQKLEYCYNQLDDPANVARREVGDIKLLVQRQQELVREHQRTRRAV